jgi:hypothetical protein
MRCQCPGAGGVGADRFLQEERPGVMAKGLQRIVDVPRRVGGDDHQVQLGVRVGAEQFH